MKTVELKQGSEEWKEFRRPRRCASESAAMFGVSKELSRDGLLAQKKTGVSPEYDSWVQKNVFDKGHAWEALARAIFEQDTGLDLYPLTFVNDEGTMLASTDGATMEWDILFEHKQWNSYLPELVRKGEIPESHYWQLEHQLLVAGARGVWFVVSDGTRDNWEQFFYTPVEGRAERLIAGWNQFDEDLVDYEPIVIEKKPEAEAVASLPELTAKVVGEVKSNNLPVFQGAVQHLISSIKTDLETDQDFANAEAQVKAIIEGEASIKKAMSDALEQAPTLHEYNEALLEAKKLLASTRLTLTKQIEAQKNKLRDEIAKEGIDDLAKHYAKLNAELHSVRLPASTANIRDAGKGKRTKLSIIESTNELVASEKINATQLAEKYQANIQLIKDAGENYGSLFADIQQIVSKDADDLKLLVESRVNAENQRLERIKQAEEAAAAEALMLVPEPVAATSQAESNRPEFVTVSSFIQTPSVSGHSSLNMTSAASVAPKWTLSGEAREIAIEALIDGGIGRNTAAKVLKLIEDGDVPYVVVSSLGVKKHASA